MTPLLQYSRPTVCAEDLIEHDLLMLAGQIDPGPAVLQFEAAIAGRLGIPREWVLCTSSCTAALETALSFFDDYYETVAVPALTFPSTYSHIRPDRRTFVDVDDQGLAVVEDQLAVVVELWGRPYNPAYRKHPLIVDAAQNVLDPRHGRLLREAAGYPLFVCYSFGPIKQITTGRGGAVISSAFDDPARRRQAEAYIDSGTIARDTVLNCGRNFQMTEPAAALGLAQLRRFDEWQRHRKDVLAFYRHALGPAVLTGPDCSGHVAVMRAVNRDAIRRRLADRGYATGLHYDASRFTFLPKTVEFSKTVLTLPCHPGVTPEHLDEICEVVQLTLAIS